MNEIFVVFFIVMNDEFFIRRTLSLAARARGMTSPNPMVGAVIVKKGKIVSEGFHQKAGAPHAEAIAIDTAGEKVNGSTLYVSLEPCCHTEKRTPPCTEKIISAGIRKVVAAMKDPNPEVSGRGISALESSGIEVVTGVLEDRARELNEVYIKFISTGRPFVILKVAMTLDGKIATPEGQSQWITGEGSRKLVHRIRGCVDAVMTAIGTVKADDPRMTCRTGKGRNPKRIIIDPDLEVGVEMNVLSCPPETIVVTSKQPADHPRLEDQMKRYILSQKGVSFIDYEGERADMDWLMAKLGKLNITSLLIESGSSFNASCIEAGIVDKVMIFIAPKIIGGAASYPAVGGTSFRRLEEAYLIYRTNVRRINEDILIEGYLHQ